MENISQEMKDLVTDKNENNLTEGLFDKEEERKRINE